MGKVSKAVKTVDKTENKSKVKKLVNNPGVSKASAKHNLKDARGPLTKILKNKSQTLDKNVTLIEDVKKSLKTKKKLSTHVENLVKPKPESKVEQVPIMKSLKRKSSSENAVKLPHPKKTGASPTLPSKKQNKKKLVEKLKSKEKPEVQIPKDTNVDKEIPKKDPKLQQAITGHITIDKAQVSKGVSAVLKLAKLQAKSKKNLFDGEHQPIFLQVSCIKIPKVPQRRLRMMLPHTLVTDTDDVALFVGDLKKGRAQDFEPTINHYEDLLRESGCTQIKDVIPLTQVKTEYDQYELKRKLLSSYDYFLTDGKIAGHLSHLLGKIFVIKRKLPTSIKMDRKDLKLEIDNALKKTSMQLHSHGNSHIVQVAHTAMKKSEILNNVLSVCKNLAQNYPGGWTNIRSLILKTSTSLPVPIYITLKSKNKVKVPVVVPTRPKAHRIVSGELSTAPGNSRVVVKPDGTVTVRQNRNKKNKEGDKSEAKKSKLKTTSTEGAEEDLSTKNNDKLSAVSPNVNTEDSEDLSASETDPKRFDDSEDEIEEAEQAYLNQWQEESNVTTTIPKEKEPKKKKSKIVKKKKTKA